MVLLPSMHLKSSVFQDEKNLIIDPIPRKRRLSGDDTMASYNGVRSLFNNIDAHQLNNEYSNHEHHEHHEQAMSKTKLVDENIAPFLAKHIPSQYAPLGKDTGTTAGPSTKNVNSRYCYRHRPDLKCRRQADELSMDHLQWVCLFSRKPRGWIAVLTENRNYNLFHRAISKGSPTCGLCSRRPLLSNENLCYGVFSLNAVSLNCL
jgi:hypothetical protein